MQQRAASPRRGNYDDFDEEALNSAEGKPLRN
jgi:hypothetical protein